MFDFQPRLEGSLLSLRPLSAADWEGLYQIGGEPEVWAQHPHRDRFIEANFRAYFEEGLVSGGALVALDKTTGAIAGWSRYSTKYVEPGEIEIGWTFLGRAYWGGAWNGEMKRLMLAHAFQYVDRVVLRIDATNPRSRRAAEKVGAKLSSRETTTVTADRTFRDLFYIVERGDCLSRS